METNRIMVRLYWDPVMLGPGKADLLAAIAQHGSISAAGRSMGMSYKRAWSLVEAMNKGFSTPLVTSARGGAQGGGASLTQTGQEVLQLYRQIEKRVHDAARPELERLGQLVRP